MALVPELSKNKMESFIHLLSSSQPSNERKNEGASGLKHLIFKR